MDNKFADALRRELEKNSDKVIKIVVESSFWPTSLKTMTSYERIDDDTQKGTLSIMFSPDGDGHATVFSEPDPEEPEISHRFRTDFGGGKSLRTLCALRILAVAMDLDNNQPKPF